MANKCSLGIFLATFLAMLILTIPALANTVTVELQPGPGLNDGTDDGSADKGKDTDAWGYQTADDAASQYLYTPNSNCNSGIGYAYVQFLLDGMPKKKIISVKVETSNWVYFNGAGWPWPVRDVQISARKVTSPWNEIGMTYGTQPSYDPTVVDYKIVHTVGGGTPAYQPPWSDPYTEFDGILSFDITNLYKGWADGSIPNYGLMFHLDTSFCNNGDITLMRSSDYEGDVSLRPKLVVEYDDTPIVDADGDGYDSSVDCNDNNAAVNPGHAEVCNNNIDDNCNGQIDENCVSDSDGDGVADSSDNCPSVPNPDQTDSDSSGMSAQTLYLRPNANGDSVPLIPYQCPGDDWTCLTDSSGNIWRYVYQYNMGVSQLELVNFQDLPADVKSISRITIYDRIWGTNVQYKLAMKTGGTTYYGTTSSAVNSYVEFNQAYTTNPQTGQPWTVSDINNIQAGVEFLGTAGWNNLFWSYIKVEYTDSSGDGVGDACDCNDNICDGREKDYCIAQGTPDPACCIETTFYQDSDKDGFGNAAVSTQACTAPEGYVSDSTDCNDNNAAINPGATEVCDGVDNDCDGQVDEGFNVGTACSAGVGDCQALGNFVCKADGTSTECNVVAGQPTVETCNNIDDDCDGMIDENLVQPAANILGLCSGNTQTCSAGTWFDTKGNYAPVAEICGNGKDDNCNGQIDEGCGSKAALESILKTLQGLQSSNTNTNKELSKSIDRLQTVLYSDKITWMDENHLACKHGNSAFDELKGAVESLSKISNPKEKDKYDPTLKPIVDESIAKILDASRVLATTLVNEATQATKKDVKSLQGANQEISKGDEARAKGDYNKAIDEYKKAWQLAKAATYQDTGCTYCNLDWSDSALHAVLINQPNNSFNQDFIFRLYS